MFLVGVEVPGAHVFDLAQLLDVLHLQTITMFVRVVHLKLNKVANIFRFLLKLSLKLFFEFLDVLGNLLSILVAVLFDELELVNTEFIILIDLGVDLIPRAHDFILQVLLRRRQLCVSFARCFTQGLQVSA